MTATATSITPTILSGGGGGTSGYYYIGSGNSTITTVSTNLWNQLGNPITTGSVEGIIEYVKKLLLANGFRLPDGMKSIIELPDGTKIEVKVDGSYEIKDADAKVVYRANRMREFNPFLNASDKLENFIQFCRQQGIRKDEMLQLPINLFIGWLILEAAKADAEPEPEEIKLLPALKKIISPHCKACGKFIRHELVKRQINFCKPTCFEKYYMKC